MTRKDLQRTYKRLKRLEIASVFYKGKSGLVKDTQDMKIVSMGMFASVLLGGGPN